MRPTALALFILLAAGCGGDEGDEAPPPQAAPGPAPERLMTAADLEDTATVSEGDPVAARESAQRQRTDGTAAADGAAGQRPYTVQVAAFLDASLATEWSERLRRQGMPVWTSVAEIGGRTFHRVRVGATPSVTEARRLGSMITDRYEWPVWVTSLTPAERPPENATRETRRLLESG